jgi:ribosomal protein S18 acetylase RimI-like enzyme
MYAQRDIAVAGRNHGASAVQRGDLMALSLRAATREDLPFLRKMLYEAVYWRSILHGDNPPFDEGLDDLDAWGQRKGDTAIVAILDSSPVGAVWYRFYSASNAIRGFIDEGTPVLVLAVAREHRRCGIGTRLVTSLIQEASNQGIHRLSLMVSNNNHAYALYKKCGFRVSANVDDSRLMVRDV